MTGPQDPFNDRAHAGSPYDAPSGGPAAYPPAPPAPYPGAYPGHATGAPGGYYPPPPFARNDLAVWSLCLGIAAFVLSCGFFTGIPAIIVGHKARRAVAAGEADNGGMATAGIILGWVSVGLSVLGVVLFLALFGSTFLLSLGSIPDGS